MATGMSRREFVERSAQLAILAGLGGSLLSACGSSGGGSSAPSIPLARLDQPVTLPDNGIKPVASGLQPEKGTLKVLNYADYINPDTVSAFESALGTKVEISTYDTEDKLSSNLRNDSLKIDLVIGATTLGLPRYVAGKLVQPLNKDYLPNFSNVLQSLQSPYYDVGSKYSAHYTVYTTGVAYRRDIIDESTFAGDDGWKLLWDSTYKRASSGVIDDKREALTLGMYYRRDGHQHRRPKIIDAAEADVKALVKATDARFDILAYQKIPEGTSHSNQAWSGDMVSRSSTCRRAPTPTCSATGSRPAPRWPTTSSSSRPARAAGLAHSLIDFLLDPTKRSRTSSSWATSPRCRSPRPTT